MENNKQENPQKPVVVYGVVNIGCDQTGATFQTLVEAPKGTKTEEAEVEEVFVPRQLHFFDMVAFGSEEKQPKLIAMLKEVVQQIDTTSGRGWFCIYAGYRYFKQQLAVMGGYADIAYHFYIKRVFIMKGYADFFTDIERLLPGQLTKVKQEEPKGDKRYKSYTEALASECGNWFILDGCLPEMAEWRSSKFNYRVDDNRRSRIQNLVKEVYQGLKDAES